MQFLFDFSLFFRWCAIARRQGIEYLEIPPFFTQWGAKFAPWIVVNKQGNMQTKFGWDTPAEDREYGEFLQQFIPALQQALLQGGFDKEHVYYHISDEPDPKQTDQYMKARRQIDYLLEGCHTMDAISDYDFYRRGLVKTPVVANNHIQKFIDEKVENLWMYYCCAQHLEVPNRFFAMPSSRSRIIGVLMYYYKIKGFLHWGFNFYNSQFSLGWVDPFVTTHSDYGFPSGDPFLVYPGEDGYPLSSIRGEVLRSAFDDYRALQQLELLAGRKLVEELILEDLDLPLTFTCYPKQASYFFTLRKKINREILLVRK